VDDQPASGTQDTEDFIEDCSRILDVEEHVGGEDRVERLVGPGDGRGVAELEGQAIGGQNLGVVRH
jgi:hypothetical protein